MNIQVRFALRPPSIVSTAMGKSMLGITELILICAAVFGLALLIYRVRLLRRIDRATAAIRFLLFRDYEQDITERGIRPLLPPSTEATRGVSSTHRH